MALGCSQILLRHTDHLKKKSSPLTNWNLLNDVHFAMFMKLEIVYNALLQTVKL